MSSINISGVDIFHRYTEQYCNNTYLHLNQRSAFSAAFHSREMRCIAWLSRYYNISHIDYLYGQHLCNDRAWNKILFLEDADGFRELRIRGVGCNINVPKNEVTDGYILKAIALNSTYLLEEIIKSDQIKALSIIKQNENLLIVSYQKQLIDIAAFLIKNGAAFYGKYIAYLSSVDYPKIQKHINDIKNYSATDAITQAEATAGALLEQLQPELTWCSYISTSFYEFGGKVKKSIEEDILKRLELFHPSIQDLFNFFALFNLNSKNPLKMIVPNHTHQDDAFFHHGVFLLSHYVAPYVYVANNRNHSVAEIVHEMAHALFYFLFENEAKVYQKNAHIKSPELFQDYKESVFQTLLLVSNLIGNRNPTQNTSLELMVSQLSEDVNMLLIQWYIESIGKGTIQPSANFSALRREKIITTLNHPQLNSKSIQDQEKDLKLLAEKIATEDELYVIYRINDWIIRRLEAQEQELVVRLPELFTEKLSDKSLLILKPLEDWWKSHISPLVQEYIGDVFHHVSDHQYNQEQLNSLFLFSCSHNRINDIQLLKIKASDKAQEQAKKDSIRDAGKYCDIKKVEVLKQITSSSFEFIDTLGQMYEDNPCSVLRQGLSLYIMLSNFEANTIKHNKQFQVLEQYFSQECLNNSILKGEIDISLCEVEL